MDATAAAVKEENFEIQSSCVPIYRLPPPVVRTMAEHRPSDKVDDQTFDDGPIFAVIFTGRFRHWLDPPSRDNWTTHPPDSSINQSNNQSIDTLLIWTRRGRSRRGRRGNLSFSCRLLSLRFFFSVPFSSDRPIPSTATRHMTGMPLKVPGAGWWWAGSVINPLGRPGVSTFHISLTSTGRCEQSIKSHAWQHLSIRKRRLAAIVRQ